MRKIINKISTEYKNARRKVGPGYFRLKKYFRFVEKLPVEKHVVLAESKMGKQLEWNMVCLLQELSSNPRYQELRIFVAVEGNIKKKKENFLRNQGMERICVILRESEEYYRLLATAGFLLNDSEFPAVFMKRQGQKYMKLWDVTPIRATGKSKKRGFGMIGNQQKNFFAADYLFFANEFSMEQVQRDYMLENIASSKVLISGYPRNEVLFHAEKRQEIREKYGMDEYQSFVYFPVRRAKMDTVSIEEQCEKMIEQLWDLDKLLSDHQRIYAKLQSEVSRLVDWGGMRHIVPMPAGYSTYEVLGAVDGLITDYSGVMLDYAALKRPMVRFCYDEESYMAHNSFAVSLEEFPFPKVKTVQELADVLSVEKSYDDRNFIEKFCPMEQQGVTKAVCARFFLDEESPLVQVRRIADNGKKNVVIFGGDFRQNGITTSLINLLNSLDRTKFNYIILYKLDTLRRRQDSLKNLPEDVAYMGFYHVRSLSLSDTLLCKLPLLPYSQKRRLQKKQAMRDVNRVFGGCRIDKVIQFNGYVDDVILLFEHMPCNRTIYVHNDMEQEIKSKGNVDKHVLTAAYRNYDSVAVVTPDLIPVTEKLAESGRKCDRKKANLVVVKNIINYQNILEKAALELEFDKTTQMNMEEAKLWKLLASPAKKFITVGRFSKEKGHARLIDAFEKLWMERPDTCLIILGGYGNLYEQTVKKAAASKAAERIAVIYYMSNPFPLVKKCDYFVLSSFYEGFGLVLAEADLVGIRCISTAVVGPKIFMENYGGYLMENSEAGILHGMRDCLAGKVPERLTVDYEQYNREAVEQFESLIS